MATIKTSKGDMDEVALKRQTGSKDDAVEKTSWTEFWHGGKKDCDHTFDHDDPTRMCLKKCGAVLVKRDVTMKLKKNVIAEGVAAMLK